MKKTIFILLSMLLFQVVIGQSDLHFANPYVDRAIYYTPGLTLSILLLLSVLLVRRKLTQKWVKPASIASLVLIVPICVVMFLFSAIQIAESRIDLEKRMYVASVNHWQYYAHTLRRSALDGLAVDVMKEKELGYGLSLRKLVHANELIQLGLPPDSINLRYFRYYVGMKQQ